MSLSVTLTGCIGVSDRSRSQAEGAFLNALLHDLGGDDQAVRAFHAVRDVTARYGGELPLDAEPSDRDTVARWEDAYSAGVEHAFIGWISRPDAFAFTVSES